MKKLFYLLLLTLLLTACAANPATSNPAPSPPASSLPSPPGRGAGGEGVPATLRIENGGAVPIDRLVVIFPDERREFTAIAPGAVTDWVVFEKGVYAYAAFEGELAGQTFYQAVIDWVGESPLPGKAFTYVVTADPAGGPRNLWITTLQVRSE